MSDTAADQDPCAITAERLAAFATLTVAHASVHATVLEAARQVADLTTPRRVQHFMAQTATETGGFTRLVEGFVYKNARRLDRLFSRITSEEEAQALSARGPRAVANRIYGGRLGNGPEASGDGWRFRGRGYLQLTGRTNYREFGEIIGRDLEACPEDLERPDFAATSAALYWRACEINRPADADNLVEVTRPINKALAGLGDRRAWLKLARRIWP